MDVDVLFACVSVSDLARSADWYSLVFGRNPDIVVHSEEVMWKITESAWLYLLVAPHRAGRGSVTISVGDLRGALTEIGGRGIATGEIEAAGDAGLKSNLTDPDGNVLSVIEVKAIEV
jgi:hypothetical protein